MSDQRSTSWNPAIIRLLLLAGMASFPWFASMVVLFASMQADYSHASNYVSDLGATTAHHSRFMNLLGFVSTGILIVLGGFGSYLAARAMNLGSIFAVFIVVFGAMFCGIAVPSDVNSAAHLFFAVRALVPLDLAIGAFSLVVRRLECRTVYKYLFLLMAFAVIVVQLAPVQLEGGAAQRVRFVLVFAALSSIFLCLLSGLKGTIDSRPRGLRGLVAFRV